VARIKNHALGEAREVAVEQLAVRHYGSLVLVAVADIVFFKGAGDYVEIHLKNNSTELHSSSLESLEKILPPHFERVHKSYVVDMRNVRQIRVHGGGRYELELSTGQCIPLSRSRYNNITERLSGTN
jgi:DNA-binding LytR/AlgR family response regulator